MKNPETWKKILQALIRVLEIIAGFLAGSIISFLN